MNRRRRYLARAGITLGWGAAFFVGLQVLCNLAMEDWRPALRDPEYGFKLGFLQKRLAEEPGRPVLLMLGSSRAGLGFRPNLLRSRQVVLFNFSMTGAGPVQELLCLRRLLGHGIRPDALVIEVTPVWLHQEGDWSEEEQLPIQRLGWKDLKVLSRYSAEPESLQRRWLLSRLLPCYSQRYSILSWLAPDWLPDSSRQDGWTAMDAHGWLAYSRPRGDEAAHARALAQAHREYERCFVNYRISEVPDRALRELVELCRQERIPAALLVMPEGGTFRSWYPPGALAEIDAYVRSLSHEYDLPLVDARDWFDESYFFDSHHLYPHGSEAFTKRIGREVLQPLAQRIRERDLESTLRP